MSDKEKDAEAQFLDLTVDADAEPEDAVQHTVEEDAGEDAVEGHGFSGFDRPS
jgi:hypothetical protein